MSWIAATAIVVTDESAEPIELGTFDSVQLTGRELRDGDGEPIAWLDDGYWRIESDMRLNLDIVLVRKP